jgi:hypothetical protein
VTRQARPGAASLIAGFAIMALAQLGSQSVAPPLFDGVVVAEPYRWLQPPTDHPGGATGASATLPLKAGQSDLVAVATSEMSPQAQIFAAPGSLTLPSGATSVIVSIQPVVAVPPPPGRYIDGNVYLISVTDQTGAPLTAPASAKVSIVLRSAAPDLTDAVIARFDGSSWIPLLTSPSGPGSFLAVVTVFGDFAVVASGTSPYPTPAGSSDSGGSAATAEVSPPGGSSLTPLFSTSPGPSPGAGSGGSLAAIFLIGAVLAVITLAAVTFLAPARAPRARRGGRR